MVEIWKTSNIEDMYEISDIGNVRNIKSKHTKSIRSDRYGYDRVTLYPSGKTYTIHRLVAEAFLVKQDTHTQVNHKDGDKRNNVVSNLEWCDASHNSKHRDTVLKSKWTGQLNPLAKLSPDIVRKIKYEDYPLMNNKEIGDLFSVSSEQVRRIRSGERWKHI